MSNKGGPGSKDVDLIRVRLTVINNSGATITDVTPGELSVSGAAISIGNSPSSRGSLPNFSGAYFDWDFDLNGNVGASATASATGPNGEEINIGPVDCGTIAGGGN